ncbi:phage holin family protein [Streptomyces sp. NPDC055056]
MNRSVRGTRPLTITAALGAMAAVMAIRGKKHAAKASSPIPESTIENVKADVAEIKRSAHR